MVTKYIPVVYIGILQSKFKEHNFSVFLVLCTEANVNGFGPPELVYGMGQTA